MAAKIIRLSKRYNKDGSVSLIARKGRVVFRSKDPRSIDSFVLGWYGDNKPIFNRPRFSKA